MHRQSILFFALLLSLACCDADSVRCEEEEEEELLPTPASLKREIASERGAAVVDAARASIARILAGEDDRLLVLAGPCSIHDVDASMEYARILQRLQEEHGEQLLIVMRTYFEKPRTTLGWKGLINDPLLDSSHNVAHGLRTARTLLRDINKAGVACATEFLDPTISLYISDLISYGSVGARTCESQTHREMASGLRMPVGIKNPTSGDVQEAVDAVVASSAAHHHVGINEEGNVVRKRTTGNKGAHVILRGGKSGPNYNLTTISTAVDKLEIAKVNSRLVIDCSHGNSFKQHLLQQQVAQHIAQLVAEGNSNIAGVMLESFLLAGKQATPSTVLEVEQLEYGKSITDACMDIESTVKVIEQFAEAVKARRRRIDDK